MYSIRATAVSGRTISSRSNSAPLTGPDTAGSNSGSGSVAQRNGSGAAAAAAAALQVTEPQQPLPSVQPQSSSRDDGDTDMPEHAHEHGSSRSGYNRPMHVTDGTNASAPAPAAAEKGEQRGTDRDPGHGREAGSRRDVGMNKTLASSHHPYPQQQERRPRRVVGSGVAHGNGTSTRPTKTAPPDRPIPTTPKRKLPNKQVVINSPLVDAPTPPTPPSAPEAGLVKPEDRWRHMSELAGSHRQNPRLLDLSHKSVPPRALQFGVPPGVAAGVTHFKYDGVAALGQHELPAFLDVVERLFPNLEHISLGGSPPAGGGNNGTSSETDTVSASTTNASKKVDSPTKKRLDAPTAAADREKTRMHRLYLLYRLPDLRSIDGVTVTESERCLARPSSPAGQRVKGKAWLTGAMRRAPVGAATATATAATVAGRDGTAKDDDDDESDKRGGDGGRDTASTSSVIDSEDGRETCSGSAVEVSICGLVNYVRTEKPGGKESSTSRGGDATAGEGQELDDAINNDGGNLSSSDRHPVALVGDRAPESEASQQLRIDVKENSGGVNKATPGRSRKRATTVLPRGSRPPPSPASVRRHPPAPPKQKRGKGKRLSSRRLWRQRNSNVASMVDDDEEEGDEEDAEDDDNDEEEPEGEVGKKENGISWSGTLETSVMMDGAIR